MATANGNWVATDDFRAKLVYTTSSTDSAVTISATLYLEAKAGWSNNGSGTLTIKRGSTTDSASGSGKAFSTNQTVTICSKTVTVNKTASAQTVSLSGSVGASYTSSKSTASASVTVPALPTYRVSYDANGGSGAPAYQTKTYGTTLTLSSTKPIRTGYTFSKWNTKSDGSGTSYAASGSYKANAVVTLYAIWTANTYTVSYNANSGSGAPASQTKTYGKTLTLSSTKPTRTGYTFLGWARSSTATAKEYSAGGSFSTAITANTVLYAVWSVNTYTITPNANGGQLHSECTTLSKVYNDYVDLWGSNKNPTREGHTFSGWNTNANGTGTNYSAGQRLAENTISSSITLYAKWTIDTYQISYNGNSSGVTGVPSAQTKTYGVTLTLSSDEPIRTGYTFLGWASSDTATSAEYAAGDTYPATNNIDTVLYAVWQANGPLVTLKNVWRGLADGTPDDEGPKAWISLIYYKRSDQSISFNLALHKIVNGSPTPIELIATTPSQTASQPDPGIPSPTIDPTLQPYSFEYGFSATISPDLEYRVLASVSNGIGSTSVSGNLGTAYYPIDAKAGGTGIAFGRASTRDGIADFAFPIRVETDTPVKLDLYSGTQNPIIQQHHISYNTKIGESVPEELTDYDIRKTLDVVDTITYISQLSRTSNDDLYKSFVVQRNDENDVLHSAGFYIHSYSDGTGGITFTGTDMVLNTRTALGASGSGGIWPASLGGTGHTSLQATRNAMGLGDTLGALPAANGGTGYTSLQATRNAMGLGNTTGALPAANGGTGQTSLQATRNAMGLGNTTGALPIANGGTGKTTAADARAALGAAHRTWTQLATSSNDSAMTYDLSDYYEVMFVARAGTDYVGSVVLPKAHLSTTSRQVYLSGGQNSSSGGRGFAVNATSTKATPAARRVDGTQTACTWWTYAR